MLCDGSEMVDQAIFERFIGIDGVKRGQIVFIKVIFM